MSLLSIVTYPNIASAQGSFTFSFSYINGTDIDAFVDGVKVFENNASTGTAVGGNTYTVTFSSPGSNTLTFTPNVPAGSDVRIERNTDLTTKEVDFSDGSVLTEVALDNAVDQVFFAAQEAIDKTASTITEAPDGKWDAQSKVIKNLADPVNNTDAVNKQFISTNLPNITTVAGISSDVTTVAGISSDVTAVAADASDIGTVATNISSVNTVATNIADVVTVANDLNEAISEIETAALDLQEATSEIDTVSNAIVNVNNVGNDITNVNTVATNIANVNTTAGSITNVNNVGGDITNVNTVATDIANVNSVAGNATNINTVASNNANVTTVAGISTDVTTVANDGTDIGTVATNISDVNTVAANNTNVTNVANNTTNITNVANNSTNINAVANNATNINAVANNATNINAVAADATDIGTVATNITNVNNVGTDITNVNTVASNLTNVNNFADTYYISATEPSGTTVGDLWFDTTADVMKVKASGGFVNAGSSVNGTSERKVYTAGTASGTYAGTSLTTFPVTYDAGFVDVYLNGVKMQIGTDVTATSGTDVVFANAVATGDIVDIVAFGTFELSTTGIGDLTDVDLTGLADNQILRYDSASSSFQPEDLDVYDVQSTSTGFFDLPSGTTAQRPTPVTGMIRYNTTLGRAEVYDGQGWSAIESPPTITSLTYANSTTAADPAGGETITIIGDRFDSSATVSIAGTQVGSVTYNSQTSLSFVAPAKTAGSYTLEVTNPSGISGRTTIEYSNNPSWTNAVDTILATITQGTSVNITGNTAAEGSDTIAYSETTSVLTGSGSGEMGLSLNSSTGAITGTAPSVTGNTTFTFTLRATDDENQTTDRQFKIKVLANYFGSGSDGDLNT